MEKVVEKSKCCGCTACMNVCPKGAIRFEDDYDGFKYPYIDQEKCVDCGLCKKKCPVLNTKSNESLNKCYAGYNKDDESLLNRASSGSIFDLIANYVLENNGIVVGAAFDKNNKLKHIAIQNKEEIKPLKGSKYLQSDLGNIFKYIKENISNRKVLFVGTPCQVAGIKSVIKNNNLICIDVICHGVPTPKLFDKYIKEIEKKYNDKVLDYNFRDKITGWDNYSNTIIFNNNKKSELYKSNSYMKLFLSDVALRNSCYNCNFKLGNKYSDITLGDFWGIKNYYPKMYNKKGVSAIILNTELGKSIFENISDNIFCKKCNLKEIIDGNPSLKISCKINNRRKHFFNEIDKYSINQLSKKYVKNNNIIKRIIYTVINRIKG